MNFETSLRTAQAYDYQAGQLNVSGATGGPAALASQTFFIGINDSFPASFGYNPTGAAFTPDIFTLYNAWSNSQIAPAPASRGDRPCSIRSRSPFRVLAASTIS